MSRHLGETQRLIDLALEGIGRVGVCAIIGHSEDFVNSHLMPRLTAAAEERGLIVKPGDKKNELVVGDTVFQFFSKSDPAVNESRSIFHDKLWDHIAGDMRYQKALGSMCFHRGW